MPKLIVQLKDPLIDTNGSPRKQIAGEFYAEGGTSTLIANTMAGVLLVRESDYSVVVVVPDDDNMDSLPDHIYRVN